VIATALYDVADHGELRQPQPAAAQQRDAGALIPSPVSSAPVPYVGQSPTAAPAAARSRSAD